AWHDPRPADHVVVAVGQQTDRDLCLLDFALKRAAVIGLVVPKKPLAPARGGVLLSGSEDSSQSWPPLSGPLPVRLH
ncbi:MAG: hypothetical protein ACRDQA_23480, partial [Nocardioidaceae bacterium]